MKLIQKNISSKDGSGNILLIAETPEDLWHAYNLLQPPTDLVRCTTLRKVINTTSTGSTSSEKKRLNLTIRVSKVDFDPVSMSIRLSGQNVGESNHVRMGAHHTLTLETGRKFSIEKECWDQVYLDRIEEACVPEKGAEICGIVMQPGLAHLCLVTGSLTIVKAKIETNIPKKRTGSSNHPKALTKFYDTIYRAVLQHVDFSTVKCVLCAGPGYVKDDFHQYMLDESVKRDDRSIIENKGKFVLCRASSGHKHALEEVFADPAVMSRVVETRLAKEIDVLNRFMRMMDTDPDRAYYGLPHVLKANEELVIDSLMITDELFRSSDIASRKVYVRLVESVKENGGTVYVFSSLHVSGKQLKEVSGVAALLRYPLPDLEQLELDAAAFENNGSSDDDESDDDVGVVQSGEAVQDMSFGF